MNVNNKEREINKKLFGSFIAGFLIIIFLTIKNSIVSELSQIISFGSIAIFIVLSATKLNKIDYKNEDKFYQTLDLISLLLWTLFFFQLFFSFCFFRATVDGNSMLPTLYNEQNVIVRSSNNVKNGDIVVISVKEKINTLTGSLKDGDLICKRIIGVPGDNVYCINGDVYVNGEKLDESYLPEGTGTSIFNLESVMSRNKDLEYDNLVIPEGYYLVLGDNRTVSNDSRYMGLFHESQILGIIKYEMKESIFDWEKVK